MTEINSTRKSTFVALGDWYARWRSSARDWTWVQLCSRPETCNGDHQTDVLVADIWLIACPCILVAQQATIGGNVNLRTDASTMSTMIELLHFAWAWRCSMPHLGLACTTFRPKMGMKAGCGRRTYACDPGQTRPVPSRDWGMFRRFRLGCVGRRSGRDGRLRISYYETDSPRSEDALCPPR